MASFSQDSLDQQSNPISPLNFPDSNTQTQNQSLTLEKTQELVPLEKTQEFVKETQEYSTYEEPITVPAPANIQSLSKRTNAKTKAIPKHSILNFFKPPPKSRKPEDDVEDEAFPSSQVSSAHDTSENRSRPNSPPLSVSIHDKPDFLFSNPSDSGEETDSSSEEKKEEIQNNDNKKDAYETQENKPLMNTLHIPEYDSLDKTLDHGNDVEELEDEGDEDLIKVHVNSNTKIKNPFLEEEAEEEEDEFAGIGGKEGDEEDDDDSDDEANMVYSGDEDVVESFDDIIELHR